MTETERQADQIQSGNIWHAEDPDEILRLLESDAEGLSLEEAARRLEETGPNSLEQQEGRSAIRLLIGQVKNPLIYLLAGAAAVSAATGHAVDAAVIAGVVVLNTVLGFIQEWRAEGALEALRKMAAPHARVLRDNQSRVIDAAEVVTGDVILIEAGDRIPADARLLSVDELQVDESALTGESQPVEKSPGKVPADAAIADRTNMVWMSTTVTAGVGRGVIVATGMRSQMGEIAGSVRSTEREETPLQKRMNKLSALLGIAGIILAGLIAVLGLLRGYELVEMLLFAVAVAVAAIPEGLPAVITVTLALGVRRMAARNAIIRRLPAVETLGSTTVICTDKTGTITKNQMTVRKIWAGGKTYGVTGEGYDPEGEVRLEGSATDDNSDAPRILHRIAAIANDARLRKEGERWVIDGDPSEGALLVAARKAGSDPDSVRSQTDRLDELPFSSERKYMAVLCPKENGGGRVAYVKGAPDRLLGFCSHVLIGGNRVELDDRLRDEIESVNESLAEDALRVMGGASREFPESKNDLDEADVEQGLTLAGLWGMFDPPRAESVQAVADAKEAGIHPVMITGDHATTALAIARQVGIGDGSRALTAADIDGMDNKQLAAAALQSGVFARVAPSHKLRIMVALKEQGHIVAMTGDGVNDAPALKGADIGIAMGRTGTEVVKEAADMILTSDDFATIVSAVEEGRVIFNNLRRVTFFLLTTNLGEILTLAGALLLGFDLPLTAVMILWVNLVTDGVATVPLGLEPKHKEVLQQPPRDPKEPIINRSMIGRIAFLSPIMAAGTLGLFWYELQTGTVPHARTVAFTTLAAFQWFHAVNARSQYESVFSIGLGSNRWLLIGIVAAILLQIGVVHTELGQTLFGTTPLTWADWGLIVLVSSTIWLIDEVRKQVGGHGRS